MSKAFSYSCNSIGTLKAAQQAGAAQDHITPKWNVLEVRRTVLAQWQKASLKAWSVMQRQQIFFWGQFCAWSDQSLQPKGFPNSFNVHGRPTARKHWACIWSAKVGKEWLGLCLRGAQRLLRKADSNPSVRDRCKLTTVTGARAEARVAPRAWNKGIPLVSGHGG